MDLRQVSSVLVVAAVLLAGPPAGAVEADPEPGTAEWYAREAANFAHATGRTQDVATNPDFAGRFVYETAASYPDNVTDQLARPERPILSAHQWVPGFTTADPYRARWSPERGRSQAVSFLNRYGARTSAHVWAPAPGARDPVTGDALSGPLPGVVIATGTQSYEGEYWWAAQGLAEAGYTVMTYDLQREGRSDTLPQPALEQCDPSCATVSAVESLEDALTWFLSAENPFRAILDPSRIGLAGHSRGAGAATRAGNSDDRVDAVVGWDNASLTALLAPRVPTMGQNADYELMMSPFARPPNRDGRRTTFVRFRDAGVPAMQVALRGSSHLEWDYAAYLPASQKGERVAMHYTLAWFDRWLKGTIDPTQTSDAVRRLTAPRFDGSADSSATGAGWWDPSSGTNRPHTIGGECAGNHLSLYYASSWAFDGLANDDMRKSLTCS